MNDAPPDLGVVIVSFNTRDLVEACLRSLRAEIDAAGLAAEVWVVDNASADGTPARVAEGFPWVRLVAGERNIGFAAANNVVVDRWAVGADPCPRWVLLLNPDTEVRPGAIRDLIAALEADPGAALAGPALVYPDGRFQHAAFRFPGLIQTALDLWPVARWTDSVVNGRYPRSVYADGRPFPVDLVLGACMLVRREALQSVGGLDDGYFMYCEEVDWCRRFRDAGWRVLCVPRASVVHHGGASSGQFRVRSFVALWRSRRRYFGQHAPAWKRRLIEGMLRIKLASMGRSDRRAAVRGDISVEEAAERAAAYRAILAGDPSAPTVTALGDVGP